MVEDALAAPLRASTGQLGRRTALEFVYAALREAILAGALPGGSRLVQSAIAESLEVSTTPVREALRDLASEGLVTIDHHRGAVVRKVDDQEVRDIYEVRMVLEPLMIRRTVERITSQELDQLSSLQDQMDAITDVPKWLELNNRFHTGLADAARWPLLTSYIKSLQDKAIIYMAVSIKLEPTVILRGNKEHRNILEACRDRDAEQAAFVVERHVKTTIESFLGHPGALDGTADTS